MPTADERRISAKAARFTESVIREMSRVCALHGGVNLAQGFPDFAAPLPMKQAACDAILADVNQYAVTWGAPSLRAAIAERTSAYNRVPTDADANVTVCCGATEAMIASLMAVLDPGDEVIVFEPFYENYGPDCVLSGATPRMVRLHEPDWSLDEAELRASLEEFRADELAHRDTGLAHGAAETPGYEPLSAAIKTGSRLAIWLSERV